MESELINFPILFTCEATKQEQEMRLLLKKEYVHDDNHDILMVRSDDADAEGFALAEIMGKDSNEMPEVNVEILFLSVANRNAGFMEYDDFVKANDTAREMFEPEGGIYGVKFENQLRSIEQRSLYPQRGHDYPFTIIERAVFYWQEIATHQCFFNGNKRTALLAALMTLEMNGYDFDLNHEQMYDISVQLAEKKMGKDELYDLIFNKVSITLITSMKQFQIYEEVKKNV